MNIEIKIGGLGDMVAEIKEVISDPKKAEKLPETTVYLKPELIPKIFSKQRIRLLREIREENANVSQLSKRLNRKIENISRDLTYLREYGIVDLKRKGREKIPVIVKDRLVITI